MSFTITRGTNISHWLSQSEKRGEDRKKCIPQEDFKRIVRWGMDHIRLPIDEDHMWDEKGSRDEEAFELLNFALDSCEELGLKVVLDLHSLRSHSFDDAGEPAIYHDEREMEKLGELWLDLSRFLENRSNDLLAYELLNQAVARNNEDWNSVFPHAYRAVRSREPFRTVILGSNKFNHWSTFGDLAIPKDDYLMLTLHFYEPMFVSHCKAPWHPVGSYEGNVRYPGYPIPENQIEELKAAQPDIDPKDFEYYDIEVMRKNIQIAKNYAERHGLALYCGEFGALKFCAEDIRERWYTDLRQVLDEKGIGWANWDYKGLFGLLDEEDEETPVKRYLLD